MSLSIRIVSHVQTNGQIEIGISHGVGLLIGDIGMSGANVQVASV